LVDYFKGVNKIEEQNIRFSQEYLFDNLRKYEQNVNVLTQTLVLIDKAFSVEEQKFLKPEYKIAMVMLASRFLISSKCLFNMIMKGYYFEAFILMRNLQESVHYCICFAESNDYAKLWFEGRLKYDMAFKKINKIVKASCRKHLKDGRDFLNDFTHSKMPAIARFLKYNEPKPIIEIQRSPEFRKDVSDSLLRAFRSLNASMLLVLVDVFKKDLDTKTMATVTSIVREEQNDLGL
jgi:hypothetical protein